MQGIRILRTPKMQTVAGSTELFLLILKEHLLQLWHFIEIVIARYEAPSTRGYSFADDQKDAAFFQKIASLHCVTLLMNHSVK